MLAKTLILGVLLAILACSFTQAEEKAILYMTFSKSPANSGEQFTITANLSGYNGLTVNIQLINSAGATLSGTTSQVLSNGVATFPVTITTSSAMTVTVKATCVQGGSSWETS